MVQQNARSPFRSRRIWLVNRRYQLFFAAVLVLFQVDIGLVYQAVMQSRIHALASQSDSIQSFLRLNLWTACLPSLLLISLGMGAVVYLLGIRFSNQIVGPLPRLSKALRAMAAGDTSQRLTFRPGDALAEVAGDVNALAEALACRDAAQAAQAGADLHAATVPLRADPRPAPSPLRGHPLTGRS